MRIFFFYFVENSICKIYQKYGKIDKGKNKEATMQNRPIIIGVTGGSGGGKTSVSRAIFIRISLMKRFHD